MDSHEEVAQSIEDMVHGYVHFDLPVASPPLPRSETRANDPADTPRRWRGRCSSRASPAALRRRSLQFISIAKRQILTVISRIDLLRKSNGNPEKSGRPVDSHEEWAQNPALIREMVSRDVHFDLLVASPPLRRSETRANDPLGTPRRWRGRWACCASPAALRRHSLPPTSIGK